jgi:hypothetical protein
MLPKVTGRVGSLDRFDSAGSVSTDHSTTASVLVHIDRGHTLRVDPTAENPTARKRERARNVLLDHAEFEVASKRRGGDGTPHRATSEAAIGRRIDLGHVPEDAAIKKRPHRSCGAWIGGNSESVALYPMTDRPLDGGVAGLLRARLPIAPGASL